MTITAFGKAWDLLKMPFVPGSIRVAGVDEGDDEYFDRTRYEADFYDPVDEKTRRMRIDPTWKRKTPKRRGLFSQPAPKGIITSIELPEDELQEPEIMFGMEQQEPFAYFAGPDPKYDLIADRMFTPSHLRNRGIATALHDATQEFQREIAGGEGSIVPDHLMTRDAIKFWHAKTGGSPWSVLPMGDGQTVGDDQYYRVDYGFGRGGRPRGKEKKDPTEPFDEAWERMFGEGQLDLREREETEKLYEAIHNCPMNHGDADETCTCMMGHPWFMHGDFSGLHPNTIKEHEAKKSLYPASWILHDRRPKEEFEEDFE